MRKTTNHQIGEPISLDSGAGPRKTIARESWWLDLDRETFRQRLEREQRRIDSNPISRQSTLRWREETSI